MTHCSTFSKILLVVFLIFPVTTAVCQRASSRVNACQSPEVTAFDFQVGIWQEVNDASVHEVKKILGGCVIQENWTGGSLNDAVALKSYDKGTQRWYLSWVSSALIHQLWEGRKDSGHWRFYREWVLDGKPMLSRTYWTPLANDRLERIVEQSQDGGKTWRLQLVVAEMMTHVHDSHADVGGSVINEHFGTFYAPICVRLIEDALVVTHFYNKAIAKSAGVEIGDIVLKVDGVDAKARLARYAKYISSSTSQNNADKASLAFMNGKDSSFVELTVRDRTNRVKEVKLPRKFEDFTTLYHRERSGDIIKLLPGNIGYADLDRLTVEMIDEMLERFRNTRAIIFDMRGYPNGVFWVLAPRLTEKQDVAAAFIETPLMGQISAAKSSESFFQTLFPATPGKWIYKGKIVMLIDERSVSQAEHTGLFLRAANGTKFIGSHTAGANGEITTFSVPGGISVGFSGQSVRFPDVSRFSASGLSRMSKSNQLSKVFKKVAMRC
jgi:C-terminal processing protease CtpA/Prc